MQKFCVEEPSVILPAQGVDLYKWASIACDQFTQDADYWQNAASIVSDAPSSLNLVIPEIYLKDGVASRVESAQNTMRRYVDEGVFGKNERGFIYVERETTSGTRRGLIGALDLEQYDWNPKTTLPIRASEATIEERLPPRMQVRRGALLELPHILILYADKDNVLMSAARQSVGESFDYNTELMLNGGRVRGRRVKNPAPLFEAFRKLQEDAQKTGSPLFAVGDGNHSLASAKAVWEERKKEGCKDDNPLRYALAELVNLYDESLKFEPIHRVLLNVTEKDCAEIAQKMRAVPVKNMDALISALKEGASCGILYNGACYRASCKEGILPVAEIEDALQEFCAANSAAALDYIHGAGDLAALCRKKDTMGFLLPPFDKNALFKTIAEKGALPRKSFSMGEARDKRYYMEARFLQ